MTKKQSLYYLGAVVVITILGFLYTSVVKAPDTKQVVPEVVVTEEVTPQDTETEAVSTPSENNLLNTSWRWLRTENATGTIINQPLRDKPFILSFADSDSMGSQTDCNSLAGSYLKTDSALSFGPLVSTKMFCEDSQETEYVTQLQLVTEHAILNNMLLLSMGDNRGIMFFVKVTE